MDIFHLFACLLCPLSWYIYTFCRFSFEITPYGEILKVYHPKEDDEVLATKKGFAALLASKLRGKQQVLAEYLFYDGYSTCRFLSQ